MNLRGDTIVVFINKLHNIKALHIHTAVDTAGNLPFSCFEKIMNYTDLFLYDIKSMDPQIHKQYTGADNRLILENLQQLLAIGVKIWIRVPVIPGVNDTEEEMQTLKAWLRTCGQPEKIELLPYHAMGEHKYAALGQAPRSFAPPEPERLEQVRRLFQ